MGFLQVKFTRFNVSNFRPLLPRISFQLCTPETKSWYSSFRDATFASFNNLARKVQIGTVLPFFRTDPLTEGDSISIPVVFEQY